MNTALDFKKELTLRVKPGETVVLELTARPDAEEFPAGELRIVLRGSPLPAALHLRGEDRDYEIPVLDGMARHARLPRGRYSVTLEAPPPRDAAPGRVRLALSGDEYTGPVYLANAQRTYELTRDGEALVHDFIPPGTYELTTYKPEPRPGAGRLRLNISTADGQSFPERVYLIGDDARRPIEIVPRLENGELVGEHPDITPGKYRLALSPPELTDDDWLRDDLGEKLTVVFRDAKNMGEAAAGVIRRMARLVGGDWGEDLKSVNFVAYAAGEGGTRIRRESEALARAKSVSDAFAKELGGRPGLDRRALFEAGGPLDEGDVLIVQAQVERKTAPPSPQKTPCSAQEIIRIHTVKKGDKIIDILRDAWNDAPESVVLPMVPRVKELNKLKNSKIYPNDKLRIPAPPHINLRASWGAEAPKMDRGYNAHPTPLEKTYDTIVIHHAGDTNAPKMKEIQVKHFGRGFADVGYHFGVDLKGKIWEGRDIEYIGSHVSKQNTGKIGLVLMGDFETEDDHFLDLSDDTFTAAMEQAALRMICYLKKRYPSVRYLGGHRDFKQTVCPGNLVYPLISRWRKVTGLAKPPSR